MNSQLKPDRQKLSFYQTGMLSFPALFPGQAEDSQQAGSKAYKLELVFDTPDQSLVNALAYCAQFHDFDQRINPRTGRPMWERHIYGAEGRLKKLEEYPKRKPETYPYAVNKYVVGISKVVSLKGLKMEGANLTDPLVRAEYDRKVAQAAPKVSKFLNPHDPADEQWVGEENQRRQFANMPPIMPEQMHLHTRPVRSDEVWAGWTVKVFGRVYWDAKTHKTGLLALEQVLCVAPGDRLVAGEASPDDVFGSFAPTADLAPAPQPFGFQYQPQQAPINPADPWAAYR